MRALPSSPPAKTAGGSRKRCLLEPPALLAALLAASVLLAAAGVTLLVLAAGARDAPAAGDRALTDAAETRQVTAAVSAGVAGIYSYNFTDLGATTSLAREVLAGQAAAQYAELARMLPAAVTEKLIVATKVTAIGVTSLTGDSATLLVFLRQTSTRDGRPAGSVPAQVQITARRTGGRWLITGIAAR
jgi:Mce-associated membrane protein